MLSGQVWEVAGFERERTHPGLKVRSRPKSKTRRQQGRNDIVETSRELRGKLAPVDKVTPKEREEEPSAVLRKRRREMQEERSSNCS